MTARRVWTGLFAGLTVVLVATGLTGSMSTTAATPTLKITSVVSGLDIPWDLTWVDDVMLFDQRAGQLFSKVGDGAPKPVTFSPKPDFFVQGEGGLLGLVADPEAAANRRFYTCQAVRSGPTQDVRVLAWKLAANNTTAEADGSPTAATPVVKGLPLSSGRHSGCRLRFGSDKLLYVGTGDAAQGANPQNRQSLGGKVLRVGADGAIPTDNPFFSEGGNARYIWSYGHRNVQGLAVRPGTTELWSAEQGTGRDDEVNRIRRGANHGWDPVPGYDESTPMTDLRKFPNAAVAKWSSGKPTIATSGLTFLEGSGWGYWQGAMAVGLLKGQGIMILVLDPSRNVTGVTRISGLTGYGRIRAVQQGPDGALYFTTSNGSGKDQIGRIEPTAVAPTVPAGGNVSPTGVTAARTGTAIYAFIRVPGGRIDYKRSTNDGGTWDSSWKQAGVTSTNAPSAASSATGRIDLVTGNAAGEVIHSALVNGVKADDTNLGGEMTAATISSLGNGTLDVYGLGRNGTVSRKQYDGDSWSEWSALSGGPFTAVVGASPDRKTDATLLTARGADGQTFVRTVTPTGNGSAWEKVPGELWSAQALGDRFNGEQVVAASQGSDGYARLERGSIIDRDTTVITALKARITSAPDVVTRPDGSWLVFGRGADNTLQYVDSLTAGYPVRSLGGTVR